MKPDGPQNDLFTPDQSECWWCGAPAEALCDATIGLGSVDREEIYTCDAAMCAEHATVFGQIRGRGRGVISDTIDHCPEHAGDAFQGIHRRINQNQADASRREMHQRVTGPQKGEPHAGR